MELKTLVAIISSGFLAVLSGQTFGSDITISPETGFSVMPSSPSDRQKIKTVKVLDGVTEFPAGAFDGCGSLREVEIPDTVTNIGEYAFYNCTNLERLVVGSGVEDFSYDGPIFGYIEEWDEQGEWRYREVSGLPNLRELVLGSPEFVPAFCMDGWDEQSQRRVRTTYPNVTNVVLNGRFEELPEGFLGRFPALQTVTLPEGITEIPPDAFGGCFGLREVEIPDTVTNIGEYAFFGCTNLERLVVGAGVVSIPEYGPIFGYMEEWEEAGEWRHREVPGLPALQYLEIHSQAIVDAIYGDFNAVEEVVVGDEITWLPEYFWYQFPNLKRFTAPSGLGPVVGEGQAFVNGRTWCYEIVGNEIRIYNNGQTAVSPDGGDVVVPDEIEGLPVTMIGWGAFMYCYNTHVIIGEGVSTIDPGAFMYMGSGTSITVDKNNSSYAVVDGVLYDKQLTHVYRCMEGVVAVDLPSTVRTFSFGAFQDCRDLRSVVIPEGVVGFNCDQLFYNTGLETVSLPNTMTELGYSAFMSCDGLMGIKLPDSLRTLNFQVFCGCRNLREVVIPNGVTNIAINAFSTCYNLTNVVIGSSVESIDTSAFWGCTNLLTISFAGNAPWVSPYSTFHNVPSNCVVYVNRGSTGWGVDIPGRWNGMKIEWADAQGDPIPDIGNTPTAEQIQSALQGSQDARLEENITDAATYNAYREWALKIGASDVKASPFAWASFATDSAALLAKMPTDEDLKVEEFKPSPTAGSFDFTVSVKDVKIGDKASVDNLKKLFGLEGAESLDTAAFSSENVSLDFKEPQDGKLKFSATPAVDNAKSFFMKAKVK